MKTHTAPVRVPDIRSAKHKRKLSALTAYDYTMARLVDAAGVDIILVGDSVASVMQGHETTLPVTMDEMIYHCRCVARGASRALLVGDMPFLSYQPSPEVAIQNAGRLLKEGGVAAVKLEGGEAVADLVARIVSFDIPVMGHVGLTPQSYHRMGGHRIQGRQTAAEKGERAGSAEQVIQDAIALDEAGAFAIVLEGIPADVAETITTRVSVPTIGIGAGDRCDGQILVVNDMLGLTDRVPSFVKQYANLQQEISHAVAQYVAEVQTGSFPVASARQVAVSPLGIN